MKQKLSSITTIIFTVFSVLMYSQTADSLKAKRVCITTSVFDYLPTINLNTGNFNIGSEIYLKNRKSVYVNLGVIKSYGPTRGLISNYSLRTEGLKLQMEGRHYFNKRKIFQPAILLFWLHIFQFKTQEVQNAGYYIATNISFQNTKTDKQETIIDYIDNNPFPNTYHYKQNIYTVDRNIYAFNIKFGYQCIKKRGFTVDYAVGLGAQYISSSSRNRMGNDQDWPNSENDIPWKKLFDKGAGIYPRFVYQLKLGWAF